MSHINYTAFQEQFKNANLTTHLMHNLHYVAL